MLFFFSRRKYFRINHYWTVRRDCLCLELKTCWCQRIHSAVSLGKQTLDALMTRTTPPASHTSPNAALTALKRSTLSPYTMELMGHVVTSMPLLWRTEMNFSTASPISPIPEGRGSTPWPSSYANLSRDKISQAWAEHSSQMLNNIC